MTSEVCLDSIMESRPDFLVLFFTKVFLEGIDEMLLLFYSHPHPQPHLEVSFTELHL